MPADRFSQQSLFIAHSIECARAEYLMLWRRALSEWQKTAEYDAAWLTYSANYILRTAGVYWALDPFSLFTRIGGGEQPDFLKDLSNLQFVALSHAHNDHLDRNLLAAIACLPIKWVIPSFMVDEILQICDLREELIIVPESGRSIAFGPLTLTPFDAQHFRGENGVPEMGYYADFSGKRWLFPGDTRTYDLEKIPHEKTIDGVFAHLWLGKACALKENPPLLNEFCSFLYSLKPKKNIITHLHEFGRKPDDFWDIHHFQKVQKRLMEMAPLTGVSAAFMGQEVLL
jgi:hypothetical protein